MVVKRLSAGRSDRRRRQPLGKFVGPLSGDLAKRAAFPFTEVTFGKIER